MSDKSLRLYSIIIPARDEEESLSNTIEHIANALSVANIPHEIIVVDDGSHDRTWSVLQDLAKKYPSLAPTKNQGPNGFGRAVVWGLDQSNGDAVATAPAGTTMRTRRKASIIRPPMSAGPRIATSRPCWRR